MDPSDGSDSRSSALDSDGLSIIAAFMLGTAGLGHLSAAPGHMDWWVFGGLFLLASAVQIGLAVTLLVRPARAAFAGAVALSLGLIGTWAISRTSGLPVGPGAGSAEGVGFLDALVTLDEVLLVAVVGLALSRGSGGRLLVACEAVGIAVGVVLAVAFAGGVQHG